MVEEAFRRLPLLDQSSVEQRSNKNRFHRPRSRCSVQLSERRIEAVSWLGLMSRSHLLRVSVGRPVRTAWLLWEEELPSVKTSRSRPAMSINHVALQEEVATIRKPLIVQHLSVTRLHSWLAGLRYQRNMHDEMSGRGAHSDTPEPWSSLGTALPHLARTIVLHPEAKRVSTRR